MRISDLTESSMWETGSYERKNIRIGSMESAVENPILQPCCAMELRGSGRPTLGKKAYSFEKQRCS